MPTYFTDPKNAAAVEALTKLLSALSYDEVLTYESMSDAIGTDIRSSGSRWLMMQARRVVEADSGSLYETVRQVGIKRLPPSETASVGTAATRRIRRQANTAYRRLGLVKGNDIEPADQARIEAYKSLFGAISAIAREKAVDKVMAQSGGVTLPTSLLLEALK